MISNRALEIAALAGRILLENGAEISRVEETMERIANHYGVEDRSFFVLSNGIFSTSGSGYAKAEYIPFKGAQLMRVSAVNQLCRDICSDKINQEQALIKLSEVRDMKPKHPLVQILGSAIGSAGFCVIFGGGKLDLLAAFVVGAILWTFVVFVSAPYLSKIAGNIVGSLLATSLCITFYKIGFGVNLGNMIIGSLIPLIPGIPFTNGIRDIANEDYIAGTTRLLDALMVFFAIAIGVALSLILYRWMVGSMIVLNGVVTDPLTSRMAIQLLAAFVGTVGFSILFGVPSNCYIQTGVCASIGWMIYLLLWRFCGLSIPFSTFFATLVVLMISRSFAVTFKQPGLIFLITGIFPMVPGGGLFWTAYYLCSEQLVMSLSAGALAIKIVVAIVLGIVAGSEIPHKFFKIFRHRN